MSRLNKDKIYGRKGNIKFDKDRQTFVQAGTDKAGPLTDFKLGEVQFGEPSTWNMKADEFMQKRAAERNQVTEFSKILPRLQGKPDMNDIDILYAGGSPKEKREMRQKFKEYNFHKRKFKEDIRKEAIAKMKITTTPVEVTPAPEPAPVKVPEKDVREIINERAAAAAQREKTQIIKELGSTGLGLIRLRDRGLLDD